MHTAQGIVNTFEDYVKALLNKLAIESPDNKFIDFTLKDGSKGLTCSLVLLWIVPLSMTKHKMKAKYTTM